MLEKVREKIQLLPDPTILFLFLVGLILGLKATNETVLKCFISRLIFPPALLFSVFAAALWRRPVARRKNSTDSHPPPGIVPNARKLVARGEVLRLRDAEVTKEEHELRKGQLKLEMLRKEITQRLPTNSSPTPNIERAPVADVTNNTSDSLASIRQRSRNEAEDDIAGTVQIPF